MPPKTKALSAQTPPSHNLGPGMVIKLQLANYSLGKTVENLFGRVNFEISCIYDKLPLSHRYKATAMLELSKLFKTAQEEFEAAVKELPHIDGLKIEPRVIEVEMHSPYSGQFLEVVRAADRVLTALRAAWICGQLPEANFQAQSRLARGEIHHLATAVDALFRAALQRNRKAGGDVANGVGADKAEEDNQ